MASQSRMESDFFVAGNISANTFTLPAGTVTDNAVLAATNIAATKLEHQHEIIFAQANTASASQTQIVHRVHGATGEVIAVKAGSIVKCVSDASITIDMVKCNSGGTTSVLTGVITLNSSSTNYVPVAGTVVSSGVEDLVAEDLLKVVLTASAGTGGTVATGVFASLIVREKAS